MKLREITRFEAEDDSGKGYTVLVLREVIDNTTQWGQKESIGGLEILKTIDGRDVNMISDGVYEILDRSGATIRITK